jgi:hypothetical protein
VSVSDHGGEQQPGTEGEQWFTDEDVERGARVLKPYAFDGSMLRIACDGPWHYEAHGILSSCPTCGGTRFAGRDYLEREQVQAQKNARTLARTVLEAVRAPESPEHQPGTEGITAWDTNRYEATGAVPPRFRAEHG